MAHRARLMPWFRLKDRIGHGASTYREIYQNQTVAVRVFATEEFREFLHAILKLSHQNVVTYLDCILANDSYPHSFAVMKLEGAFTLATWLEEFKMDMRLTSLSLWQAICGSDYLQDQQMVACLECEEILISRHQDEINLKIQAMGPLTARRRGENVLSLSRLTRLVSSRNSSLRSNKLLKEYLEELDRVGTTMRPDALYFLSFHPFFIVSNEDSRRRMKDLFLMRQTFTGLIHMSEFERWYHSMPDTLSPSINQVDVFVLQRLVDQFAVDSDFERLLSEGLLQAPFLVTHFLYKLMSIVSFIARPIEQDGRNSTLHMAVRYGGDPDIPRFLLDHGADVSAINAHGCTPLHFAAMTSANAEVISLLLDRGADPRASDQDGFTPLHAAAALNTDPTCTRLLISHGAQTEAMATDYSRPIHLASAFNSNFLVIKHLLLAGADPNTPGPHQFTALHLTVLNVNSRRSSDITEQILPLLFHFGANLEAIDCNGRTALHLAAITSDHTDIIEWLLQHGADAKAADFGSRTPLQLARQHAKVPDIIQLLEYSHKNELTIPKANDNRCSKCSYL